MEFRESDHTVSFSKLSVIDAYPSDARSDRYKASFVYTVIAALVLLASTSNAVPINMFFIIDTC